MTDIATHEYQARPAVDMFPGVVRRLPAGVKHPQMQWNRVDAVPGRASGLLAGIGSEPWLYFVHSFAPEAGADTVATCDYGGPVVAASERGSLWGTQFHPEKSGTSGLAVLANFVRATAGGTDGVG